MSEPVEGSSTAAGKLINIVKVYDNTKGMRVADEKVNVATFERLLTDAGRVDCPLLAAVGYPVIMASTTPGKKCIPAVQIPPRSNNPHNNRIATTAASRITTGLAMGCVVGDVYMLRQDGKHITSAEWWELWDTLMGFMGEYGTNPRKVNAELFARYKKDLRRRLRKKGVTSSTGTAGAAGYHCLQCGEDDQDVQLLRCSRCLQARYCSKECQRAHWKAGHKDVCKSPAENSVAEVVRQLLETAVLKPEQVIARNVKPPPLPKNMTDDEAMLGTVMPADHHSIFLYNKNTRSKERICLWCRTHYRLLKNPSRSDKAAAEQELSGICSYACFQKMAPAGPNSGPDWYGQSAEQPEGAEYIIESSFHTAALLCEQG